MLKHLSTGPALPYSIHGGAMAPSPDGNGVILIGGYSSGNRLDTILEMKADGQGWVVGSWTTLSTKLQYARESHIVIPVWMDSNICGLNGIVSTNAGKYHISLFVSKYL